MKLARFLLSIFLGCCIAFGIVVALVWALATRESVSGYTYLHAIGSTIYLLWLWSLNKWPFLVFGAASVAIGLVVYRMWSNRALLRH